MHLSILGPTTPWMGKGGDCMTGDLTVALPRGGAFDLGIERWLRTSKSGGGGAHIDDYSHLGIIMLRSLVLTLNSLLV